MAGRGDRRPAEAEAASSAAPGPRPGEASAPPSSGGCLFIVATPIGNLGDVTYRAVEVLGRVPLVAAEDTRLTRRLFARYGIETRLVSYHARSGAGRLRELLDHLRAGLDLAVVTDAGTPLVSDPGAELAAAWAAEGGTIVPIPGASAVLAALVASGLVAPRWSFEGFLPRRGRERRERLERLAADERAAVLYEAPSRIAATLADLAAACGADRPAAVCRELTKIHEQVIRGPLGELVRRAASGDLPARGEFAVVLGPGETRAEAASALPAHMRDEQRKAAVDQVLGLVASGLRRAEAVRRIASATGIPRRDLYRDSGGGPADAR